MAAGSANGTPKPGKEIKMEDTSTNGGVFPGDATRIEHKIRRRARRRSKIAWVIDKASKLSIWYIIYLVAFACPATEQDITSSTSWVCKPYFQVRSTILPHVQPTYDQYVAPYAQKAQPYLDQFHSKVYQPGLAVYNQHGAPVVAQAQKLGQEQWAKTVKPQFEVAKGKAGKQFDAVLGPHIKKVQDAVRPQVASLRTSINDIWELELEPVYRRTAPYADKLYKQGQEFAVKTAFPQAQYASSAAYAFWIKQIWPKLRIIYGENVEPQLMRITERLGRYQDEMKVEAEVQSAEISASAASVSSAASSTISSAASVITSSSVAPSPSLDTQERFRADLDSWELACATAVKEGAEHLQDRIEEIVQSQISSQVDGVGNARVTQLETAAEGAISSVKARILAVVAGIPDEDAEERDFEAAHDALTTTIRSAVQSVKKYATAVREWRDEYDHETSSLISKALASTLETVGNIRDLRLTEIGRSYASSSLPHKEWAKYNDLKKATQDWQQDLQRMIQDNAAQAKAIEAGRNVLGQGMSIAEDAAKELSRLKEVGMWKIESQDASDDFESKTLPPVRKVKHVLQHPVEAVSEAVFGDEPASAATEAVVEGFTESAESIASAVTDVSSEISETASSAAEAAVQSAEHEIGDAGEQVAKQAETVTSTLAYAGEEAASSASSLASEASQYVGDAAADASEHGAEAASQISEDVSSAFEAASETIEDTFDEATSTVGSVTSSLSKVWGGVAAQAVPSSSGPILDDVIDDIEDGAASVSSYISEQVAKVTSAMADVAAPSSKGAIASISSVASEKYEAAVKAASSALYGDNRSAASKGSNAIREQYLAAITAASYAIYGTPTTAAYASSASSLAADAASVASLKYSEAVAQASSHWVAVRSRVSLEISGTPKPIHEQMYSSAESAYSDAVALASSRLDSALLVLPTASAYSAYASISSVASSQLSQALKTASAQYHSAKIAVGAEPTPAHQAYLANAQQAYYHGIGVAYDQYSSFVDAAKSAVGATTPGYMEAASSSYSSAVAVASADLAALVDSARSAVGATTVPAHQSVLSGLSAQYSSVVAAASSQLAAASSHASVAVYGEPQQPVQAAVSAASSSLVDLSSQASANWNALVAKASSQIYGTPVPFTASVYTQASVLAAQATNAAAVQYDAISSLFSELVSGREPDFTESAFSRLSSAYYTGVPQAASAASSYASEAYQSASSVISSVFTPPPTIEAVMESVTDQLNALVNAASVQVYGSSTGPLESATSAAASAYSDAASRASEAVYGSQTGYAEAASSSFLGIAESATKIISEALFGTPTGPLEGATKAAADTYSSLTSVAGQQAAAAASAVSSAVYGPEQGAWESAQSRIASVVESAQRAINSYANIAGTAAESLASDVQSAAASVTQRIKDEL